jgi:hypothetical protein
LQESPTNVTAVWAARKCAGKQESEVACHKSTHVRRSGKPQQHARGRHRASPKVARRADPAMRVQSPSDLGVTAVGNLCGVGSVVLAAFSIKFIPHMHTTLVQWKWTHRCRGADITPRVFFHGLTHSLPARPWRISLRVGEIAFLARGWRGGGGCGGGLDSDWSAELDSRHRCSHLLQPLQVSLPQQRSTKKQGENTARGSRSMALPHHLQVRMDQKLARMHQMTSTDDINTKLATMHAC